METATVSPGAGGGAPSGSDGLSGGSPTSPAPGSGTPSPSGAQPASGSSGQTPPVTSPANNGPVPYDRFEAVNNRLKSLEWAEAYQDPDVVQRATQLWEWFDQDPEAAYDFLTQTLTRSGAIRRNQLPAQSHGQGQGQPSSPFIDAQTGRPLPDVVIQETGAQFYSAQQAEKLLDWKLAQLDQRLAPLEGQAVSVQAQNEARAQLAEAEKWDYFSDFAQDIFKEMQRDRRLSLEGAYRRVVVPKMRQKERETVMAEMRRQGAASTANPAAPAASSPAEDSKKSIAQLFREEMRKRGMGT